VQVESILQSDRLASRFGFVFLLLLASTLRLFRLDAQNMWFDEAARLLVARSNVLSIVVETGGDTLPSLYHLLMHLWRVVGRLDFYVRTPFVIASLLLVAVMAALG
jgi:hypothetical protein